MTSTPNRRPTTPDVADIPTDADADDDEPERGPLRRCVLSRERLPKERMIRFALGPNRALVPDYAGRLPGRGIWLSADRVVIEGAKGGHADPRGGLARAFARAARGPVTLPADLLSALEGGLSRRIGDTLGLARRAGQAVAGFGKAREWVVAGRAALVIQARDGSVAERARLLAGADGLAVAAPLDAATLGAVFGRDHVVHVAGGAWRVGRRAVDRDDPVAWACQPFGRP